MGLEDLGGGASLASLAVIQQNESNKLAREQSNRADRSLALQENALQFRKDQAEFESKVQENRIADQREFLDSLNNINLAERYIEFAKASEQLNRGEIDEDTFNNMEREFKKVAFANNMSIMSRPDGRVIPMVDQEGFPISLDIEEIKRIHDSEMRKRDALLLNHPDFQKFLDARITEAQSSQPNFDRPIAARIAGTDQEVFVQRDKNTNQFSVVEGFAPPLGANESIEVTTGPDGEPLVTISKGRQNDQSLNKSVQGKFQEKLFNIDTQLSNLNNVSNIFSPDFLTFAGRTKGKIGALLEQLSLGKVLSDEDKKFITDIRVFRSEVDQIFNQYRDEITGAGASEGELRKLKDTFLNADLSVSEFIGSFNQFRDQLLRNRRLINKVLREEGFTNDRQFGKKLDNLFTGGQDDDIITRGLELRNQGLSDEDIGKVLDLEGYID
jgi:hypothetical protein